MIKRGSHSLMCFAFSYDRLYWWQVVSQAEIPFWHKEKSGRSKEVGSHSPIQAVIALFAALFFEVILFSLLTGRHFTTNISTRGILWHLVSTALKSIFSLGSTSDFVGGAHDAPQDPLVGWGGGNALPTRHSCRRLWPCCSALWASNFRPSGLTTTCLPKLLCQKPPMNKSLHEPDYQHLFTCWFSVLRDSRRVSAPGPCCCHNPSVPPK